MQSDIEIVVDGEAIRTRRGVTVAVALLNAGVVALRTSVGGAPRGPLCGMGVCFECRVTIDGVVGKRACLTLCEAGMEVRTDA